MEDEPVSFTSSVHFRGTVHQWKYEERRQSRSAEQKTKKEEKQHFFVNFHPVEFPINRDLDVVADSSELPTA